MMIGAVESGRVALLHKQMRKQTASVRVLKNRGNSVQPEVI